MSSLPSQQSAIPPAHHTMSVLTGSGTFSLFHKDLKTHCMSNFGKSGQEILSATVIPLVHTKPGPPPHYNEERLHPVTKDPIPNSRKYAREAPTQEQADNVDFDHDTLPLSTAGSTKFDNDVTAHARLLTKHLDEIDKRQLHDTDLLNFILQHCNPTVKDTVKSNSMMDDFTVHSAETHGHHRGLEYLGILNNQFSKCFC
jgi:hypothetical protein